MMACGRVLKGQPAVAVDKESSLRRRRCCEREHDRAQWGQLVVELSGLRHAVRLKHCWRDIGIFSVNLERQLEATESHAKAHRIHVHMVRLMMKYKTYVGHTSQTEYGLAYVNLGCSLTCPIIAQYREVLNCKMMKIRSAHICENYDHLRYWLTVTPQ